MHVVSSVNRWSAANGLMSFLLSRYTGRILHLSGKVCYVCDHFYKRPYDLFISIHMLGHFGTLRVTNLLRCMLKKDSLLPCLLDLN